MGYDMELEEGHRAWPVCVGLTTKSLGRPGAGGGFPSCVKSKVVQRVTHVYTCNTLICIYI